MKYLITGSNGFVGKNLVCRLGESPDRQVYKFSRFNSMDDLESMLLQADCVMHLAGENRPADPSLFNVTNVGLTEIICSLLKKTKKKCSLFFASSKQVDSNNQYGISKLAAEKIIVDYANNTGNNVIIYRFPGIFGKWCKPNYNSVVATFCHNIARGIPISISDSGKLLNLVYIDDVVDDLIQMSLNQNQGVIYRSIQPEYQITLNELAEQIYRFKNLRGGITIDPVESGFQGALYSTFLSYLPKHDFAYQIKSHRDSRGEFVEMIRAAGYGQMSYFTAFPGVTRGGHYHHSKSEKFLIVKGLGLFKFRNIITQECFEIMISDKEHKVIDSVPGWAHSITNIGTEELIVILWANEVFDKDDPDTTKFDF